jgi:hypothetical protein
MSQPLARSGSRTSGQDFENRASGTAMLLLRVTLLGTLAAFVGVLCLSTWRAFAG